MPPHIQSLIPAAAFCTEMVIHIALCGLTAAAMLVRKARAYEVLQFWIDVMVLFSIVLLMLFKDRYRNDKPSRVPNVACFSIVFLLSLTGAVGLAIRAASGNSFCEEFLSPHNNDCSEAGLAITLSWTSVLVAIAGILVSWFDKYPATIETSKPVIRLKQIELLKRQFGSKAANAYPRIHILKPAAPYEALRSPGPHQVEGPKQPTPAQTFPQHSRRNRVPSSTLPALSGESNGRPLMLHRQMNRAVGQLPRNQATFMRTNDPQTPLVWMKIETVDERDLSKQMFFV